ncbi:single-stranded-DNA-specific exonuclease RecJ [Sulfoacidibacillus ferrooxidans]|uniref:Single-stranded-DNA-specific exonuclease RecJ n=1 Tax=Sulfoacidibacillus ferrooxidans TaxID=2005001 RepID=A0A9X1VAM3_9BACL|nr:single-stranded-DNA-specific exonuclease RecJ [Sulfoacidibacillus ferrooxidans]MCI0184473.1 Single-stranded-DNA-specific exonuclease RecJ [Sulfoacidibacillus ferrooxidans]
MKRWIGRKADIELAQQIARTHQLHPLVARIVAARGYDIESTQAFLSPSRAQLHDPFLMHDMHKAVARIQDAIVRKETVMIFGDYDVDGVSSVTILVKTLRKLGVDPLWRVPDRFCEGYGIRPQAVIDAKEQGVHLIITVDNGIAALEAADLARTSEIDLIVTDHHHIGHQLPDAYALVHPALGDYPFPELCGAGVAFKLAQALLGVFPEELLEVVALATIADQVPLIGENRIFVKEGLRQINRSPSVGIHALADVANSKQGVTSTRVAFQLAPRINAIGRLAHAKRAVELLLADDPQEAQRLALEAHALNQKRQAIQEHIYQSALAQIEEHAWTDQTLVVAGESWHEGVIGIVAGKLTQNLYKPTLCLSIKDGVAKGSGRSVPGVDLYALLQAVQAQTSVFTAFGGHAAAAGFSLPADRINDLRSAWATVAQGIEWEPPHIDVDAPLHVHELTPQFITDLKRLEPFGQANPEPIFFLRDVHIGDVQTMGAKQQHLRARVKEGTGPSYSLVAFGEGERIAQWLERTQRHVLVHVEENRYRDMAQIQMRWVEAK